MIDEAKAASGTMVVQASILASSLAQKRVNILEQTSNSVSR